MYYNYGASAFSDFLGGNTTDVARQAAAQVLTTGFQRSVSYISWGLIDKQGTESLLSYPTGSARPHGSYFIPPATLQQLTIPNKAIVSSAFYNPAGDQLTSDVTEPIFAKDGHIVGFLQATLNINFIWNMVQSERGQNGSGSYAFITDENGVIIAHGDITQNFTAVAPFTTSKLKDMNTLNRYGKNALPSVLNYCLQGMKQEFERLRPKLQVVGPIATGEEAQPNLQTWQRTVGQYSNIVVCLGTGDADGVSLAQIKQTKHNTYLSAAFDLNEAALQSVANGTNFALVDPEHFLKGYVAMRLLIEHALNGNAIPQGWWNPGALLVTQSNVQDIIIRQTDFASKAQFYQPIINEEFAAPTARIKPLDQAK